MPTEEATKTKPEPREQHIEPQTEITNETATETKIGNRTEQRGKKAKKPLTAEEKKEKSEARKAKRLENKEKRQKSWGWRIFRFVFHILWLPALLAGGLAVGLVIGYTVIGGGSPGDVFSRDLWQHLYDIVYAEG